MDVRICEKKCGSKEECKEFVSFHKSEIKGAGIQMPAAQQGVQMGM